MLHLDFNARHFDAKSTLLEYLALNLRSGKKTYAASVHSDAPEERLTNIILQAYRVTERQVVILIDEYDKPLLDTINNPELNETFRDILKTFFSVIKSHDQYIRFAFLTDVTKFSKVSVFSGLNNLRDLSLSSDFSAICGITMNGYLTIKEYIASGKIYHLEFPNNEIRYSFIKNLLDGFASSLYGACVAVSYFMDDIEAGNDDRFMTRLTSILASIPYRSVSYEKMDERDF